MKTNYELLDDLRSAGSLFVADNGSVYSPRPVGFTEPLEDPDRPDRRYWTPEIEAQPSTSHNGHTDEWVLTGRGALDLHEVEHSRPVAASVYQTGTVYGGPEEGGWDYKVRNLQAVYFFRGFHPEEAFTAARQYAYEQGADHIVRKEIVVGSGQTVGSRYYCLTGRHDHHQ